MNKNIFYGFAILLVVMAIAAYVLNINNLSVVQSVHGDNALFKNCSSPSETSDITKTVSPDALNQRKDATSTAIMATSASLFKKSSEPKSIVSGHEVEYPGQFAAAAVRVGGKDYHVTPNQLGSFPRILVPIKSSVHVEVCYPDGHPGDAVVVETEDGGTLDGKKMANVSLLDAKQSITFNLKTSEQPGIYHVALRNGADTKVFNFWAGPEPKIRQ